MKKLLAFSFNSRLSISSRLKTHFYRMTPPRRNFPSIYERIPTFRIVFSKEIETGLKVSCLFKTSRNPALSLELCWLEANDFDLTYGEEYILHWKIDYSLRPWEQRIVSWHRTIYKEKKIIPLDSLSFSLLRTSYFRNRSTGIRY